MKKHFFIATCVICFVCCPLFAATHTNGMCLASCAASEQNQSTDWKSIGEIVAYLNGDTSTDNKRTFQLYTAGTGEVMYKIKADSSEYIVAHNPLYNPDSNSGVKRFKYIAGDYYLNLGPKITTEWESIGKIDVYIGGSNSSKRTVKLYASRTSETMYKIKLDSSEYIVTPNPSYDSNCDYGKNSFKYVAGQYYLNLGAIARRIEMNR